MNKGLEKKRYELYKKWTKLKDLLDGEQQTFEQFQTILQLEDKYYKQWKFYDNYIKAQEKAEGIKKIR